MTPGSDLYFRSAPGRLDVLDVMRGVAVFGILLVNIDSFIGHGFITPNRQAARVGARFDAAASFLAEFLVQGKFYSLFSFLFGVGFSVFVQRAAVKGMKRRGSSSGGSPACSSSAWSIRFSSGTATSSPRTR